MKELIKKVLGLFGRFEIKSSLRDDYEFNFARQTFFVFGVPVLQSMWYGEQNMYCNKYSIFGICVFKRNMFKKFIRRHRKDFEPYDEIYILDSNFGEIFLFFTYCAKAYLRGKDIKKILFVARNESQVHYVKMMIEQANVLEVPKIFSNKIIDGEINFEKWRFVGLYPMRVYINMRRIYFENILDFLKLTRADLKYNAPKIDERLFSESKLKAGIKGEKYVIFMPEAKSFEPLPDSFWLELKARFEKIGIEIFWNLLANNWELSKFKTQILNIPELLALSKNALAVVSLRSGVGEILANFGGNHFVIYPDVIPKQNELSWIEKFTLAQLPNPNNAKFDEYIYKGDNAEQILDDITRKIAALNA